jgi:hypothetical protein
MTDYTVIGDEKQEKSHKKRKLSASELHISVYFNVICMQDPETEENLRLVQLNKCKTNKTKFLTDFIYTLNEEDFVDEKGYFAVNSTKIKTIIMEHLSEEFTNSKAIDREWKNAQLLKVSKFDFDPTKDSSKHSVPLYKSYLILPTEVFKTGEHNFTVVINKKLEISSSSRGGNTAIAEHLLCSARDSIVGQAIQCYLEWKPLNPSFDNIIFTGRTSTDVGEAIQIICAFAALEVGKAAPKDSKVQALIDR